MDWVYLFGPSAFQIAAGFVIARLFDWLGDLRQDRRVVKQIEAERDRLTTQLSSEADRLALQLTAEKERLQIQIRGELHKRLFDAKFETALNITRMLQGSVQTIRSQMLLHAVAYAEVKVDVQMFRKRRDDTFDSVQAAVRSGEDAAAVADLLFRELNFGDLPHHRPLIELSGSWQAFLREQDEFLVWLDDQRRNLPPMLPIDGIAAVDHQVSDRMAHLRSRATELLKLTDAYQDSVLQTIRLLSDALDV
jgi:hypothetical protein